METLLQKIYDNLKYLKKVKNQTDFGAKLGYGKSYTSTLLKSVAPLHAELADSLRKVFGISAEWLDSEGKQGEMVESNTERKSLHSGNKPGSGFTENTDYKAIGEIGTDLDDGGSTKSNTPDMMKTILLIMERQSIAYDKDAEARLLNARSTDRLTSILDRLESRLDAEYSMQVK